MESWACARRRAWRVYSEGDNVQGAGGLRRVLGIGDLTFLGLGSILGAGVYVLSGVTAREIAG
jgi:APA family basic amino acid/polyamine antiporter